MPLCVQRCTPERWHALLSLRAAAEAEEQGGDDGPASLARQQLLRRWLVAQALVHEDCEGQPPAGEAQPQPQEQQSGGGGDDDNDGQEGAPAAGAGELATLPPEALASGVAAAQVACEGKRQAALRQHGAIQTLAQVR